jgi:cold-inducible RNA-binding protein
MFRIYVGNLNFRTSEQALGDLFSEHGQVENVAIVADRDTGRSRGFGFVEMADESEGRAAIEALNGHEVDGRNLTVNEARPRAPRGSGGGRRY